MTQANSPAETHSFDILAVLDEACATRGDQLALCAPDSESQHAITFNELAALARQRAEALIQQGVERGSRVALLAPPSADWCIAFLAIVVARAIAVPIDPCLPADEIETILLSSKSEFLLAAGTGAAPIGSWQGLPLAGLPQTRSEGSQERSGELDARRFRGSEELAMIAHSSGSTGAPKGVLISAKNLMFQVEALRKHCAIGVGDRLMPVIPFHHLLGLTGGLLAPLFSGAAIVLNNSLLPHEVSARIAEQGVTHLLAVPAFVRLLRQVAGKPDQTRALLGEKLRFIVSGGAELPLEDEAFFETACIPVLQGYGMSETSPVIAVNSAKERRQGSVGKVLVGAEIRIMESGEIQTRGPHVMLGYLDDVAATQALIDPEGWLATGDLGELDEDGFLFFRGRMKSTIVLASGKNVEPEPIEALLKQALGIRDACVVGLQRSSGGLAGTTELCAILECLESHEANAEDWSTQVATCTQHLPSYCQPTRVIASTEPFPRTALGKLRRARLKQRFTEEKGHVS